MPAHSCLRSLRGLSQGDFREIVGGNDAAPAGSVRLSLLIPARESVPALRENVRQAHDFLLQRLGTGFEIILIPNPPPGADAAASIRACAEAAGILPRVKVVAHLTPPMSPGKGAALRTGYAMSVGRTIFFTDADLPFDLDFIDAALEKIDEGIDLVSANRRLPPLGPGRAPTPPAARLRHRLGLVFNRIVRAALPVTTTDTQAGFKAMSRRLASVAFSRGRCPGFLFDLEIFLSCRAQGWARAELPVARRRETGESTVCVPRELMLAVYWLFRIRARCADGRYDAR